MLDTTNTTTENRDKNSEVLKLQLKYKIDDKDPMLAFFYLLEAETKAIVEQNKKASVLIKDIEFHIPKMERLIQSVQRYETNVRDRILDDLNSNLKELELVHAKNLTSILSEASEMQNNFERILVREEELKEDLKNSREAVVRELEKFAFEIKLQKKSFENTKSNFYKDMEVNLKASIDKSFFNLRNFMILNSSLTILLFTYVIFK